MLVLEFSSRWTRKFYAYNREKWWMGNNNNIHLLYVSPYHFYCNIMFMLCFIRFSGIFIFIYGKYCGENEIERKLTTIKFAWNVVSLFMYRKKRRSEKGYSYIYYLSLEWMNAHKLNLRENCIDVLLMWSIIALK